MKPETIEALQAWIDQITGDVVILRSKNVIQIMSLTCHLQDQLIKERELCKQSKPKPLVM